MPNPNRQLLTAVENGDLAAVRKALAAGADVNARGKQDMSPLLTACFNGFVQIAKALVAAGADTKVRNRSQLTPLNLTVHGAAMAPGGTRGVKSARNHVALLKFLLDNGGDPKAKHRGETLLEMAESSIYLSPRPEKLIPILKRAGSKSRSDAELIEDGDLEVFEPPDFSRAVRRPEFLAAVKKFTSRFGRPVWNFLEEHEHVPVFKTTLGVAVKTVAAERSRLLKKGVFLCRTGDFDTSGFRDRDAVDKPDAPAHLAIFPTSDVYEALAAVQIAGGFEGVPVALRRLREIEDDPFNLTFISSDTLEGEFLAPPKDAAKLAARLYDLCPEGDENIPAQARRLKQSRHLFLWWD